MEDEAEDVEGLTTYPYERLKTTSDDPVSDVDVTKREVFSLFSPLYLFQHLLLTIPILIPIPVSIPTKCKISLLLEIHHM